MSPIHRRVAPALLVLTTSLSSSLAQGGSDPLVAYPERDWQSPFRTPSEVYAPPDRLFAVLRRMRAMAADPAQQRRIDGEGREELGTDVWRELRDEARRIGIDASYLSAILRTSRNDDDRRTALYAMFHCEQPQLVFQLIEHIPGEPLQALRQEALPRAADYLRVHLRRRCGDLGEEQKKAILGQLPQPGSPAAKARGVTRLPRDDDPLHELRLIPFFQLLDVDAAIDRAQGLWFLGQVFALRQDLALRWLEPALPRVRALLVDDDLEVREQAIGLLRALGAKDLPAIAPDAEPGALLAWAKLAIRPLFPPIRNVNDALLLLLPSEERDAIVAAGIAALQSSSIGDPFRGRNADGSYYAGFRVATVPEALLPLAIPKGAVITAVDGLPVTDAASLLRTVGQRLELPGRPRALLVEYVLDGKTKAVEYRVL
jgi:hypothetical protein